ncbi:hypothetical protein ACVWYG_003887 [Pedobacter sp. UYEF25]
MANVTIDLSQSIDAKEFNKESIIHQTEFSNAIRLIDNDIFQLTKSNNNSLQHIHSAITVLGTRGSGKTTFLLSLREHYRITNPRVAILEMVDPTLIEEKGHIFLNIISIINELVLDEFMEIDKNPNKSGGNISERDWNNSLLKLSHGLPSMDGVGVGLNEADWQDAEFIMEKGMLSVKSARNLSENFNLFVDNALNILNKDVFILSFDDIDIDFKKGWPVLESIRKYLHTTSIITILSGDLKLFSLAIRKQYWNNLGESLLVNEGDKLKKHNYFNEAITEMESQYLLKVIKPERRIHLTTLYEKMQLNEFNYHEKNSIVLKIGSGTTDLLDYYQSILATFGINNKYQSETYTSFLLNLPIRTQIQFLTQFDINYGSEKLNVTDCFASDLIERGLNANSLNNTPQLINVEILMLLIREKSLNQLYQLQPITDVVSLNSSVFALSILLSTEIKNNPYLIFDYFIKIGYVKNLLSVLPYEGDSEISSYNFSSTIEGLCNYSGIKQNKVLRDIAGNMTSYVIGSTQESSNNWGGIIPLLGLGDTSKRGSDVIQDRIDIVFKNASYANRVIGFLPLSICAYTTKNQTLPCYSFYTLLGSIGELIRKAQQNDLQKGLAELSEIRTYNIPEFRRGISERTFHNNFLLQSFERVNVEETNLIESINNWVRNYKEMGFVVSPHMLGKISTRFF